MSDLHILFPTPVYQNVLDFRPSEVKSMVNYMSELDWAGDKDIYEGPNGETTKPVSYTHLTLPTIYSV